MIQSILDVIPTYFLSIFRIPKNVAMLMERMMREFLWERLGNDEAEHLVAWNLVTRPKENGGLGIGNICVRNKALAHKWLWRFPLEREALWARVIYSRYGLDNNKWDAGRARRETSRSSWRFISAGLPDFQKCLKICLGSGSRVRFWEDTWIEDRDLKSKFPSLYAISIAKDGMVSDFVVTEDQESQLST